MGFERVSDAFLHAFFSLAVRQVRKEHLQECHIIGKRSHPCLAIFLSKHMAEPAVMGFVLRFLLFLHLPYIGSQVSEHVMSS